MKPTKKKEVKTKAWAVIEEKELALFWAGKNLAYEVWYSKKSAEKVARAYNSCKFTYKVLPITISYKI